MAELWLCEESVALSIAAARQSASAEMRVKASSYDTPAPKRRIEGGVETINVVGALTKRPDFWAMFFGGGNATYEAIQNQLREAAADPRVSSVVLDVDSPGGEVNGLFSVLALIASFPKPIRARAEQAQSAAYAIAAATGRIDARGPGATFGSIGVAVSYRVNENVVTLTNTDSPNKRPDLMTDAGKAVVREYLDQVNDLFVGAIAKGRKVNERKVREGYGRGASFTAENALELGMIDSIEEPLSFSPAGKGQAMNEAEIEAMRQRNAELTAANAALVDATKTLSAQIATLEKSVAALSANRERETLEAYVDQLQRDGKLQPALRAWALTQTRASLEQFAAAAAPVAAVAGTAVASPAASASPELNAEELEACRLTMTDPKDFRETRDRLAAERKARLGSN